MALTGPSSSPGNRGARLKLLLHFAATRGWTVADRVRLFYYSALKPPLAFRRLTSYAPDRKLRFGMRAAPGRRFQVSLRDDALDIVTLAEFFSAQYNFIPPELPPYEPRVIYDIGANIGIASLYFAVRYPRARFVAFEPVPTNYELCRLNLQNLPDAETFPWAVSSASGTAEFEFDLNDLRGGRLGGAAGNARASQKIQVPIYSINDLAAQRKCPVPDFLKIDVEGAELNVLEGIGEQVQSIHRMLIETHGPELEAGCRRWLAANGFTLRHAHNQSPGFASLWADRADG